MNTEGKILWVAPIENPDGDVRSSAIRINHSNDIYIVGTYESGTFPQFYDNMGVLDESYTLPRSEKKMSFMVRYLPLSLKSYILDAGPENVIDGGQKFILNKSTYTARINIQHDGKVLKTHRLFSNRMLFLMGFQGSWYEVYT